MKSTWPWAILWLATVAGAWFLGTQGAGTTGALPMDRGESEQEVERLTRTVADLRQALAASRDAPHLAGRDPVADPSGTGGSAASSGRDPGASAGLSEVKPFTLEGATSAKEAFERLLVFANQKLAEGPKGHLELFRVLDQELFGKEKEVQALLGDEDTAARFLYPMVRFLVNRESEVLGMTETVFRTMAEEPAFFEKAHRETLEAFTEGLGVVVPGAASEEQMARLRAYARKILETPEDRQPEAVQRNRRRIERVLPAWAPDVTPAQALDRVKAGNLSPREVLSLLKRLSSADIAGLDVPALIGSLVESADYRTVRAIGALPLDATSLARLDDRIIEGAAAGRVGSPAIGYWLQSTKRWKWADARSFMELGLRRGASATDVFAMTLSGLGEPPPQDQVVWILASFQLSERVAKSVRSQFRIP